MRTGKNVGLPMEGVLGPITEDEKVLGRQYIKR